jgi:ComF family protein
MELIKENVPGLMKGKKLDMVINVPLHRRRLLSREFDQAGLLAEAAAEALQLPFLRGALARIINTDSQTKAKDRKKNVRGAFMVKKPEMVEGKSVLLVDDVFTSGATMEECSRVLKKSGAAAVHLFTLARAI